MTMGVALGNIALGIALGAAFVLVFAIATGRRRLSRYGIESSPSRDSSRRVVTPSASRNASSWLTTITPPR